MSDSKNVLIFIQRSKDKSVTIKFLGFSIQLKSKGGRVDFFKSKATKE